MLDLWDLTVAEIEKLNNNQLDGLVAKHVIGLEVRVLSADHYQYYSHTEEDEFGEVSEVWKRVPRYSTDISAAWDVVEAMRLRGYWFEIKKMTCPPKHRCDVCCWFVRNPYDVRERLNNTYAGSCSLATAICRAALIAVLVGEEPVRG